MDGDALVDRAERLSSRSEFVEFIDELRQNLTEHPDEWENQSLELFLTGLRGFAANAEGYYVNIGEADVDVETPTWRGFADMLLAAKVYE
jgi:hypothetical protein